MDDREKLIRLLITANNLSTLDREADFLLAHGVTIKEPGKWVMRGGKRYCSVCSQRACVTRDREDFWYTVGTDFCPHCGAPMKGESNA